MKHNCPPPQKTPCTFFSSSNRALRTVYHTSCNHPCRTVTSSSCEHGNGFQTTCHHICTSCKTWFHRMDRLPVRNAAHKLWMAEHFLIPTVNLSPASHPFLGQFVPYCIRSPLALSNAQLACFRRAVSATVGKYVTALQMQRIQLMPVSLDLRSSQASVPRYTFFSSQCPSTGDDHSKANSSHSMTVRLKRDYWMTLWSWLDEMMTKIVVVSNLPDVFTYPTTHTPNT